MSADTMKMPEPIIEPTTIIVESKRPRPCTSSPSWRMEDSIVGAVFAICLTRATRGLATGRPRFFRHRQEFSCALGRIRRGREIADDRYRIRARQKNVFGPLESDTADRHERLAGNGARGSNEIQADYGIRILLRRRRKDRAYGYIVR